MSGGTDMDLEGVQPGSLEGLRLTNRRRVIDALRVAGAASRADIARSTGLSRSTVSSVVADLISGGVVREGDTARPALGGTGRPALPLTLDPSAGAALGIDIAHDGIRVLVTDLAHTIIEERWHAADVAGMDAGTVLDRGAGTVRDALAAVGVAPDRLVGAAAAVPSPIDPDTGVLGSESGIPSLVGLRVGALLQERLGFPVQVENDANLCALAELLWGAERDHDNAVYVKLSRGIGAGLVIAGRLYRGVHGGSGELGHTAILPDGPVCRCGNRGCLEVVAGTDALLEAVASRFTSLPTVPQVMERAVGGDTLCRRAVRDVGSMVGQALAGVVNLLNPSLIVVGGELAEGWRILEMPMRDAMDRAAIHRSAADVVLVPGTLGRRTEALGAVGLVLREGFTPAPGTA